MVADDSDRIDGIAQALRAKVARVTKNESIARYTTFRLGGRASIFVEPGNEAELLHIAQVLQGTALAFLVIGRGSNLLVSDSGYEGLVIRLGKAFEWIEGSDRGLRAGGGVPVPQLSNWAARRELTGLEFCIAIPASVGGAVRMNAGAHGSSMSDVLADVTVCDMADATLKKMKVEDLAMSYRHSSLSTDAVVCAAEFALRRGRRAEILSRMEEYRTHRTETQPVEAPNAGSMFKNPDGDSAGRLIEAAGLKGFGFGDSARVSDKHANFFLALEGATAQDVYDLMAHVQARVSDETGVLLAPEVKLVGDFDEHKGRVSYG